MQAFTGSSHTADNAATAGAVDYGAGDTEKVVGVGRHGVPSVAKAMEALGSALRINAAHMLHLKGLLRHRDDHAQKQQQQPKKKKRSAPPLFPAGGSARSKVYRLFSQPESSRAARLVSSLVLSAIVLSIVSFILESLPEHRADASRAGREDKPFFVVVEAACVALFTLEYIARIATASASAEFGGDGSGAGGEDGSDGCCGAAATSRFVRDPMNLIDLASIVPYYLELLLAGSGTVGNIGSFSVLRALRLARVFRVLKLGKFCSSLTTLSRVLLASSEALYLLAFFMVVGCVLFGAAMYFAEGGTWDETAQAYLRPSLLDSATLEPTPFVSIPACFWWVLVTATTVGYGDMAPTTPLGQAVGVGCFYFGICILALPVTIIGANYAQEYAHHQDQELEQMMQRVALQRVESELTGGGSGCGGGGGGGGGARAAEAGGGRGVMPEELQAVLAASHARLSKRVQALVDEEMGQVAALLSENAQRGGGGAGSGGGGGSGSSSKAGSAAGAALKARKSEHSNAKVVV
jgi:uncharacterized membrane protein YgcG